MITYWPHHYFPACQCEDCQRTYKEALERERAQWDSTDPEDALLRNLPHDA